MAPRAHWKGFLKLSLVSCPIALYPAISAAEKVSFRQVNRETGNRLRQQLVDTVTGEVVGSQNTGRGYEVGENDFLIVENEELEVAQQEARTRPFSAAPARPETMQPRPTIQRSQRCRPSSCEPNARKRRRSFHQPRRRVRSSKTPARSSSIASWTRTRSTRLITTLRISSCRAMQSVRKRLPSFAMPWPTRDWLVSAASYFPTGNVQFSSSRWEAACGE